MKTVLKLRSLTAALLMAVMLLVPMQMPVYAADEPYRVKQGDFVYEVWTDGTNELHSVFVVEYTGSETVIEMPRPQSLTINGKTYPAIEYTGFIVGDGTNSVFKSAYPIKIAIPDGYEAISSNAFSGCTTITEMAIAGSVGYVGENAFAGCTNLTTFYLETNTYLSSGDSGNPRIAQAISGTMNANQVTVYTKSTNTNVISYVDDTNAANDPGELDIILKFTDDPYSMSSVPPGSGIIAGGGATEQKGKDGTALGEGASESVAEEYLVKYSSENDPAGTVFFALQMKAAKVTKTSIKLSWKKPSGAVRFVVYGNKCGKGNKYVKQATTKGTSITVKKIGKNKLKKGTYYKFVVIALDKNGNVVSTSKTVHAATAGGKAGNYKAVTTNAKKDAVSLKAKKSFTLKAKAKPASKLKVKVHRAVRFESSNKKIATVSSKGVIKGLKKGTCYVYVYAQNGVCKKIKVTVK